MKNLKLIMLSSIFFIIAAIFTSNLAFAAFSESDFQGTWYGHALESSSGSDGAWVYLTAAIDDQGNFTAQTHMPDDTTGTESGKFNITSDGIITIDGESAPHGVMSSDKNTFVFTDTWETGDYAMLVFVKGGGSFSQSDLTGTWYGHTITSGSEEVWEYGTLTIDSQGSVSIQTTEINGDTYTENNVAEVNITSAGILYIAQDPNFTNFHGAMSPDKNIAVFNDTWDDGETFALTVLVKGVGSFTQSDLQGTWYGHRLYTGSEQDWEYLTATIDNQGNLTAQATDSEGSSGSGSATLSIDGNGIISATDSSTTHGVMSLDKNIAVFTETEDSNEYVLMILMKGADSAPAAGFSANPLTGNKPLEVAFTDASSGDITSRSWDFGDGSSSTEQNPSHTYSSPGKYTVSLTVTGSGGSDIETKTDYISVKPAGMPWLPLILDE